MTVEPLTPDVAASPSAAPAANGFLRALETAGDAFAKAAHSEAAFAQHGGSLLAMTLDRAQADIVLSVASAAASRAAAALSTVFNMQV